MECQICCYTVSELKYLECTHSLCQKCYSSLLAPHCPFCRTKIKNLSLSKQWSEGQSWESPTITSWDDVDILLNIESIVDDFFASRRTLRIERRRRVRENEIERKRRRAPIDVRKARVSNHIQPAPLEDNSQLRSKESKPDGIKQKRRRNRTNRWSERNRQQNMRMRY